MRTVTLELNHIDTVAALHIYLQYMLSLPDYYGRNLDALYDVLGDIAADTRIVVRAREARGEVAAYLPRLTRVLTDAERANPCLRVELA